MAVFTNLTKHAAALTNRAKNVLSFLLQETGDYLLLESGGRIIIAGPTFTNLTKHAAALTNVTKS